MGVSKSARARTRAIAGIAAIVVLTSACDKQPGTAQPDVQASGGGGSDQLAWQQFAGAIAPSAIAGKVLFETWASDQDIYVASPCPVGASPTPGCNAPVWPTKFGADKPLQHSQLGRSLLALAQGGKALPQAIGPAQGCATPTGIGAGNAAANANFPAGGCVGEEVRRDRATFDYMVAQGLWSKAGLKAYFGTGRAVTFPNNATQVKADWIPVATLATWLGKPASFVTANFYTANASVTPGGPQTAYAMTSLHVSVKTAQFPNWVWSNFENAYTPGRCDQTGCSDGFGAKVAQVPAGAQPWGQYGACAKSAAGAALLSSVKAPAVFANYCLTGSQTAYGTAAQPTLLGSPIIEALNANVPLAASSCISCHVGASFDAGGNPNGAPLATNKIGPVPPLDPKYRSYDFLWGVLGAN